MCGKGEKANEKSNSAFILSSRSPIPAALYVVDIFRSVERSLMEHDPFLPDDGLPCLKPSKIPYLV
jgi:hypothetical protein